MLINKIINNRIFGNQNSVKNIMAIASQVGQMFPLNFLSFAPRQLANVAKTAPGSRLKAETSGLQCKTIWFARNALANLKCQKFEKLNQRQKSSSSNEARHGRQPITILIFRNVNVAFWNLFEFEKPFPTV